MPRTIDLIRTNKLPSNMMPFAAKGALSVAPDENIEILVYLAKHNKIFGDLARMTLAGWDEKSSLAAASDPKTPREVLDYLVAPENLRPKLLPALLENPSVSEGQLVKFAISASPEGIAAMLRSPRVRTLTGVLETLRSNPYLKAADASAVAELLKASKPEPAFAPASAPAAGEGPQVEEAVAEKAAERKPAGRCERRRRCGEKFPKKLFLLIWPSTRRKLPPKEKAVPAGRRHRGFAGIGLFSRVGK